MIFNRWVKPIFETKIYFLNILSTWAKYLFQMLVTYYQSQNWKFRYSFTVYTNILLLIRYWVICHQYSKLHLINVLNYGSIFCWDSGKSVLKDWLQKRLPNKRSTSCLLFFLLAKFLSSLTSFCLFTLWNSTIQI